MAHTKLLVVHSAVVNAAMQHYLNTQQTLHPTVAGSLITAVQAHLKDDAAELGGLPADAHVVGHAVNAAGEVSLIIESQTFPWAPDGLPLDKMPVFVPEPAARPAARPAIEVKAEPEPAAAEEPIERAALNP